MSNLNKYMELEAASCNIVTKRRAIFKSALLEAATNLIKENDGLYQFSFTGSRPSFNDGDACIFSMNFDEPTVNYRSSYSDEVEDEDENYRKDERTDDEKYAELSDKVGNVFSGFNESDYENAFNDWGFRLVFAEDKNGTVSMSVEDYYCGY